MLTQLLANGIVTGGAYAIMALGFAATYNTTRVFHVAYGATYAVSAYACYFLLDRMHVGVAVAVLGAAAVGALANVLVEYVVYRPLHARRASLMVLLIASLGAYMVAANSIPMAFGSETKVLLESAPSVHKLGAISLAGTQVAQLAAAAVLLPICVLALRLTRLGRIIRAMRDDPVLLTRRGVHVDRVRIGAYALGGGLAGLAASLVALDTGIEPNMGMTALLTSAAAVVVGGVGTFGGPVAGGFLLGVIQALAMWRSSAQWTDCITFLVFGVFLLCRPQGIFGARRRLEEGAP